MTEHSWIGGLFAPVPRTRRDLVLPVGMSYLIWTLPVRRGATPWRPLPKRTHFDHVHEFPEDRR